MVAAIHQIHPFFDCKSYITLCSFHVPGTVNKQNRKDFCHDAPISCKHAIIMAKWGWGSLHQNDLAGSLPQRHPAGVWPTGARPYHLQQSYFYENSCRSNGHFRLHLSVWKPWLMEEFMSFIERTLPAQSLAPPS